MILCLASLTAGPAQLSQVAPALAAVSPRIVVEPRGVLWCDAHGLDAKRVAYEALQLVRDEGVGGVMIPDVCAGVAQTPIAAEVAAVSRTASVTFVPPAGDAAFLVPFAIEVLGPSQQLRSLLRGSGVERCGELAALEHESVEVRFGAEGSRLWRLSRADDPRRLFPPMQRSLPAASFEWLDYVLTEPERLLFVINGLMESVCRQLADRGAGGREMTLVFSLANRTRFEHRLRPARVTGSQKAWMRLVRSDLERIELPDAVTGVEVSVVALGGEAGRQGDLFDRGFASARVTEEVLSQLLDDRGSALVVPRNSKHPLPEKRSEWLEQDVATAVTPLTRIPTASPRLTLQLLPQARQILVETGGRRDHEVPVRCCLEDGWEEIVAAAGPDRVSGGEWEAPFSREYYRCTTELGRMVWVFREESARWFLHGWWD